MNNLEHQIHYSFDKDGYCDTQCPHCDFLLHVGSISCHQCTYFVSHDYKRQIVTPLDDNDKHFINDIIDFIDLHKNNK